MANTPHKPQKWTRKGRLVAPWEKCSACGLVYLRNEPTRRAIREGCDKGEYDEGTIVQVR